MSVRRLLLTAIAAAIFTLFGFACYRHARKKMRSLIKSRSILGKRRSAQDEQRRENATFHFLLDGAGRSFW